MLKVINVVGARPNFMKVAPIVEAMRGRADEFASLVVHTGQHYDAEMSDHFFRDLQLPDPDVYLDVRGGSHAAQTALVMQRFEPIVLAEKPDWVVVVGDVNSTLACALVCAKLGVPVAHVEAGLRSRDRTMPEEINRILTDQISDLLLTPSVDADENLRREGIAPERIRFVGNVMIDSLRANLERAARSDVRERTGVANADYAVVTLHRPSNVDDPIVLRGILSALEHIAARLPIVFPVHPRTHATLETMRAKEAENSVALSQIIFIEPLGYLDFLRLYSSARLVLTDSGGIQEETTWLGIPCLTLRENTERPVTIELGTNVLVGTSAEAITREAFAALELPPASGQRPQIPLWDGRAAPRVLDALLEASKF